MPQYRCFCKYTVLGDSRFKFGNGQDQESLGWSFGRFYAMIYLNNPHNIGGKATKQFSQVCHCACSPLIASYTLVEILVLLATMMTSVLLWLTFGVCLRIFPFGLMCTGGHNCTGVDDAQSDACIAHTDGADYCVCSVSANNSATKPFCSGLVINVLSSKCPTPTIMPPDAPKDTAAIVFGSYVTLVKFSDGSLVSSLYWLFFLFLDMFTTGALRARLDLRLYLVPTLAAMLLQQLLLTDLLTALLKLFLGIRHQCRVATSLFKRQT